jgi:AhpD family alkylhydroperoxidase
MTYRELTQSVSTHLAGLRSSTPEVMKSFGELGRAATSDGTLDRKTKELIALALSVASRCDPCIGFHTKTLVKLGATRQEIDETYSLDSQVNAGLGVMALGFALGCAWTFRVLHRSRKVPLSARF